MTPVRRATRLFVVSMLLVYLAWGCGAPIDRERGSDEIVVGAAANLTDAFEEVGRRFSSRTGVRVINSFGATADLSKQIENGAPFDIFAAADFRHVEELERKGLLVEGSRAVYARGKLVLWLPRPSALRVGRIEDIAGEGVTKIAIAKPELAPYGEATVKALMALGLWERVESKVVYAQNVAQAKQFAATGNTEAAFLPRSLVIAGEGEIIEVDGKLHQPIDQAMGIVRTTKRPDAARKFLEFVLSEEGQALLESYGYERVLR